MYYMIGVKDSEDKVIHTTICSEKELLNLLLHIDKEKYAIDEIVKISDRVYDYKEFCKKEENLEKGKKEEE